jgi:DNA-binding CsgD family transcriptional regulator
MAKSGIAALTPRQTECLRLTAELKSSKEIGRELSMSQKTVDTHIAAAIKVLGAVNRRDAARIFSQNHNDDVPDKILRQTSRLADLRTFPSSFPPQTHGGTEGQQAFQDQWHGLPLTPPWITTSPSLRTLLEGVKPDDIKPINRAMLIVVGAIILALTLAITVTFVDVLSRVTDHSSEPRLPR